MSTAHPSGQPGRRPERAHVRPPAGLDLRLYLVTDAAQCGELGVAETVRQAVAGGVTLVQLREEHAPDEDVVALGRELVEALRGTGVPLIVNDRVDLVAPIGAAGVHLGQSDEHPARARALLGEDAVIGLSAQLPEHLTAAADLPPRADGRSCVDYLGVGPVWPTGSKADAAQARGPGHLAELVALSRWPVVAIGGITLVRLPEVAAAGADGAAVISAICGAEDVTAAARELRAAWDAAAGDAAVGDAAAGSQTRRAPVGREGREDHR